MRIPPQAAAWAQNPRVRRVSIWFGGVIAVIAVLGFLVAPPLVKHFGQKILSDAVHRPVTLEGVGINPFALSARVRGLTVKEKDGASDALSFDELEVNLELESLFRGGVVLREIRLANPHLRIVRNADKTYNFTDLIEEFLSKPASEPTPFSLNNIQLTGGRIDFDDRLVKAKHTVSDIEIGVPFISNLPSKVDIEVQPAFSAKVDGSMLRLGGEAKPFKETREATLRLDLDGLQLPGFVAYSPVPLNFGIPSGTLDTRLSVTFSQPGAGSPVLALAGDIALNGLEVVEKEGAPILKLPKLAVNIQSAQVLARKAALASVSIQGPEVWISREQDGSIRQVAALIPGPASGTSPKAPAEHTAAPAAAEPAKEAAPFAWSVGEIKLSGAKVHFADANFTPAFAADLASVNLLVKGVGNGAGQLASVNADVRSDADETVKHTGTLTLNPLAARGRIEVADLKMPRYEPLIADKLLLKLDRGTLGVATDYDFALGEGPPKLLLQALAVKLADFAVRQRDEKEDFYRIAAAEVTGGSLDLGARSVSIDDVSLRDARVRVLRFKDGALNAAKILPAAASAAASKPAAPAPEQKPWLVAVKKITTSGHAVAFEDRMPAETAKLSVAALAGTVENFSTAKGQQAKFTLGANINKRGTVKLSGTAGLDPLQLSLALDAKTIEITPFEPYFTDKVNVGVTRGALSAKGNLKVDLPSGKPLKVSYRGEASVGGLHTVDKVNSSDLLVWKSLRFAGVDLASIDPLKLEMREVVLSDFYSRLILNANAQLNLQQLVKGSEKAPTALTEPAAPGPESSPDAAKETKRDAKTLAETPAAAPAAETPPAAPAGAPVPSKPPAPSPHKIVVRQVALQNGRVNFSDYFVKPNYSADIRKLGGTVKGLSSDLGTTAEVDLRGRVSDAPLEILGKINPLSGNLFIDLKAAAKGIELPQFSPYSGKYAGYAIEKGKLSVDLAYKLENRKLEAQNKVFLDQLTFGDKVESPTATKLPVLLAVSLLKNSRGEIDINLPIGGSLDDPEFSVGGVIVQVIVNLIVKAATAPFALLGSMFGGGEELAYVEFAAGRSTLSPAAEKKLETLAKALNDRPALKLEIIGRADPATDREGLKKVAVERKVKAQKFADLADKGDAPESARAVLVEEAEYPKYLERAYKKEKFPKPRNLIGMAKDLPVAEMEKLMLANVAPTQDDLQQLASRRAAAVKEHLLVQGKVPEDRVFLMAPKLADEGDKEDSQGKPAALPGRVDFALK